MSLIKTWLHEQQQEHEDLIMRTWKITITARTIMKPKDFIWFVTQKLKESLPVIKLDYEEVSERPTTTEHHGGITKDASTDEDLLWDKEEEL